MSELRRTDNLPEHDTYSESVVDGVERMSADGGVAPELSQGESYLEHHPTRLTDDTV